MVQIICEITWTCPCRCPFCNVPKVDKLMELETFKRVLEAFKLYFEDDEYAVVLSGGEPSVVTFLNKYVDVAKSLGYNVTIVTNGWNPRVVLDAKPDLIEVSIDYFGPKHDETRRVYGLFANAIRLVNEASKRGIDVVIRSTAMKDNIKDILYLREFLNGIGLYEIPIIVMPVRGAPHLKPTQHQLKQLKTKDGIILSDNCPAGISSFVVTPTREVLACIFYRKKLGVLQRFTREEIEKIVEEGRKIPRYPCEKQ